MFIIALLKCIINLNDAKFEKNERKHEVEKRGLRAVAHGIVLEQSACSVEAASSLCTGGVVCE
jgi:hypothetical protein